MYVATVLLSGAGEEDMMLKQNWKTEYLSEEACQITLFWYFFFLDLETYKKRTLFKRLPDNEISFNFVQNVDNVKKGDLKIVSRFPQLFMQYVFITEDVDRSEKHK